MNLQTSPRVIVNTVMRPRNLLRNHVGKKMEEVP
jgi:hypothetical protein